jgi:hypothetical protein
MVSIAVASYEGHPELAKEIAVARLSDFPTYTDSEISRLLGVVARRFPGMCLWTLRPLRVGAFGEHTILTFEWDQVEILKRNILRAEHIPAHPKRTMHYDIPPDDGRNLIGSTNRLRKGRLLCRIDVADDIGADHPLATFRPSSIRSGKWTVPSRQCPYLRLVVDNTRARPPA